MGFSNAVLQSFHAVGLHNLCSWDFHSLWQNNQSQGSSSYKDCEGLLRESSEGQHLKSSCASDQFCALLVVRRPMSSTSECFRLAAAQDVGLSTSFERRSL